MIITKSVIFIIDLQQGFITQDTHKIVRVIEDAKTSLEYTFCVYSRFYNDNETSFSRFLNWNRFQSKEEQEIVLPPSPQDIVVDKNTYSAITEELKRTLISEKIDCAYLCGIDTDSCVLATAFALFDIGIEPRIIIDGCASTGGVGLHSAAEIVMKRSFGEDNVNRLDFYIGR